MADGAGEVELAQDAAPDGDTIFGNILRKEIPANCDYEDEQCVAFDNVNPQTPSRIRVIPIAQLSKAEDQDEQLLLVSSQSGSQKKKLLEKKRQKELHRILLPDAPPRKRRTRRQSPEREACEMAPSSSAEAALRPHSPLPPTSRSELETPMDSPPLIVVHSAPPAVVEFDLNDNDPLPFIICDIGNVEPIVPVECEVEVATSSSISDMRRLRSAIDSRDPEFDTTFIDWPIDNDSDRDFDFDCLTDPIDCNDQPDPLSIQFLQAPTLYVNEMTEEQELIMDLEDRQNDEALRQLLPTDYYRFDWNKDKTTFKGKRETFTGTPGPTFEITTDTRPMDIFERMIDVRFVDMLVAETNRYVAQKISLLTDANNLPSSSRLRRWTPTDRPEMISYLSLTIIMGLYPLPVEESYFSFNGFGTMPYISKIMSYNRYLLLKSMLHFVNNDTLTELRPKTKLSKIQPVIDNFNDKFSSLYYPKQEIAIDESLMKWHGRLSFSQKIKSKSAQVGVKTYELCESSSGYLWRFIVYTGKDKPDNNDNNRPDWTTENDEDNSRPENDNDIRLTDQIQQTTDNDRRLSQTQQTTDNDRIERPTNATAKIVIDLIEPLLGRGHTVIMDNFYNCPLLARYLKLKQTDCYGTQRLYREFIPASMKTLTKTDLRHGEVVASFCSDLTLMVWRDSNLVSMISTYHQLQIGTNEKHNITTFKPSVILDYNKNMGGIDRKDQFLSAHHVERTKSRVWYKKVFRRLFNCAVFNCFVLYSTKHKISHRQFRITLAESLLKSYRNIDLTTETRVITRTIGQTTFTVRQHSCAPKNADRPVVEGEHFPARSPAKRGRCWWCFHKKRITTRSVWMCQECKVNLCIIECFRNYHKPDPTSKKQQQSPKISVKKCFQIKN